MKKYKISVIACIYKVEPYIEKACRSLFSQKLDGIEFIFIDDASPDKSVDKLLSILNKEFPHLKKDIKIIHNETNRGIGVNRQIGTQMASGDYIIHFDTDDWIEPEMYKQMYEVAIHNNADVVVCDVVEEWDNGTKIYTTHPHKLKNEEFKYEILRENIKSYLWNKLIRKDLILDNRIKFDDSINFMEDLCFMCEVSLYVNSVIFIPKPFYHYRKSNTNSLTVGFSRNQCESMLKIIPYLDEKLKKHLTDKRLKEAFYSMALRFKLSIMLNKQGKEQAKYSNIFPEADKYIFRKQIFGSCYKPALWLNSLGWLGGFNMIVNLIRKLKKIRNK